MRAVDHYVEGERLLNARPANEDEQEEWARVRMENIAAADAHFHAAQVALEVESRISSEVDGLMDHHKALLDWAEAFGGS